MPANEESSGIPICTVLELSDNHPAMDSQHNMLSTAITQTRQGNSIFIVPSSTTKTAHVHGHCHLTDKPFHHACAGTSHQQSFTDDKIYEESD